MEDDLYELAHVRMVDLFHDTDLAREHIIPRFAVRARRLRAVDHLHHVPFSSRAVHCMSHRRKRLPVQLDPDVVRGIKPSLWDPGRQVSVDEFCPISSITQARCKGQVRARTVVLLGGSRLGSRHAKRDLVSIAQDARPVLAHLFVVDLHRPAIRNGQESRSDSQTYKDTVARQILDHDARLGVRTIPDDNRVLAACGGRYKQAVGVWLESQVTY